MKLLATLSGFDGKHTALLEQVSADTPRNADSTSQLVACAEHDDTKLQVAATWILKKWQDEGVLLDEEHLGELAKILHRADHWEVKLHILQIFSSIEIAPKLTPLLKKSLRKMVADEQKFVRAWSYSVLAKIADQDHAFREQLLARLAEAEQDEAASVKARLRQIRKKYKWANLRQE